MNNLYAHLHIMNKEDAKGSIIEVVKQYPEGAAIDDISEQIHIDRKHLDTIIGELIDNGILKISNGRYFVVSPRKNGHEVKLLTPASHNQPEACSSMQNVF